MGIGGGVWVVKRPGELGVLGMGLLGLYTYLGGIGGNGSDE